MAFAALPVQAVHQFFDCLLELVLLLLQFETRILHAFAGGKKLFMDPLQPFMCGRQIKQHLLASLEIIGKVLLFEHVEYVVANCLKCARGATRKSNRFIKKVVAQKIRRPTLCSC